MLLWRFHKKFTLKPREGKAVLWEAMHLWSSPETSWDGIQCDGDKASQIHRLSAPRAPCSEPVPSFALLVQAQSPWGTLHSIRSFYIYCSVRLSYCWVQLQHVIHEISTSQHSQITSDGVGNVAFDYHRITVSFVQACLQSLLSVPWVWNLVHHRKMATETNTTL